MKKHKTGAFRPLFLSKIIVSSLFLMLFVSVLPVCAAAQAQSISVNKKNVSMISVIKEIEKTTHYKFFYNNNLVNVNGTVSVNLTNSSIETLVKELLKDTPYTYQIENDQVMIFASKEQKTAARTQEVRQQAKETATGTVVDDKGEPIIGASVLEKGTTNGVITDLEGKFSLPLSGSKELVISYIGYVTVNVKVTGPALRVVLKEDSKSLDEVVVVGYGAQKKVNLTGAVSMVSMDKALGNRPVTNVASALQGTIPGLVVTSSSVPGKANTFNIRGTTSINGGSPLVLVDNVPADIDMINPEDIESVSVLKDAASASIYGARGAFGVILITTKKAKKNSRLQLNYNNNFGFVKTINRPEQASIIEILETHQAWDNDGKYYADNQNLGDWIGYVKDYNANPSKYPANGLYMPEGENRYYYLKDNDPQGAILDDYGFQQTHNVSATGGGEKITYRMSLGYTNNQGTLITDKDSYDRINMSSYISADITPWLNQSLDIRYATGNRSYVESDGSIYKTYLPRFYPAGEMV